MTTAKPKTVPQFFTTIKHWGGIVIADVLSVLGKAQIVADKDAPIIEQVLKEGASVAQFIPGVAPELVPALNLGVELVGALNKTIDFTDVDFQTIVTNAKAGLPAGYSVVVIASTIEDEAKAWFASIKDQLDEVKLAANAITGSKGAPAAITPAK